MNTRLNILSYHSALLLSFFECFSWVFDFNRGSQVFSQHKVVCLAASVSDVLILPPRVLQRCGSAASLREWSQTQRSPDH